MPACDGASYELSTIAVSRNQLACASTETGMRPGVRPSVAHLLTICLTPLIARSVAKSAEPGLLDRLSGAFSRPDSPPFEISGPPSSGPTQVYAPAAGVKCWEQAVSVASADAVTECIEAIMQVMGKFQQPAMSLYPQFPQGMARWVGGMAQRYLNEAARVGNCAVTFDLSGDRDEVVQEHDYTAQEITQGALALVDMCLVRDGQLLGQRLFRLEYGYFLRIRVQRNPQDQQDPMLDRS